MFEALKRLFKRKPDNQPKVTADQIGIGAPQPANITNDIFGYFRERPDWMNPSSGWGYTKEDALVIDTDNPNLGVHNEYVFAEFRSRIEVQEKLNAVFDCFVRGRQLLMEFGSNHYDVLEFKVYYFTFEDFEFLKNDFESHNKYENDDAGLKRHNQLRFERIKYYSSECWININSFFGKY